MMEGIKKGEDYARILIGQVAMSELQLPVEKRADPMLVQFWYEEIVEYVNEVWKQYKEGTRETFLLNESEMMSLFDKATSRFTEALIMGLLDKELIKSGISPEGDIVYSLSNKGEDYLKEVKGEE